MYAFGEGVKKAYSAVTPPVEGTILTVAREAIEQMDDIKEDLTIGEFGEAFRKYMYHSLENTPELLHILKEAGVIDSGGAGLYLIADGVVDAINGEHVQMGEAHQSGVQSLDFSKFTSDSELKFGYCTEFLLRLMNKKVDVKSFDENIIIDYLKTIGDSIVLFPPEERLHFGGDSVLFEQRLVGGLGCGSLRGHGHEPILQRARRRQDHGRDQQQRNRAYKSD